MNTFFTCEQKLGNTIFTFSQKAKVLSTSPLNGGLTRHLSHAVNINCMNGSYECKMLGDTYEKDLAAHIHALGLSPSCTTALSTAAWTELRAIEEVCFRDLTVTAVVTGGIDSNGMHPGDPASYCNVQSSDALWRIESCCCFSVIAGKLLFRRDRNRFWN